MQWGGAPLRPDRALNGRFPPPPPAAPGDRHPGGGAGPASAAWSAADPQGRGDAPRRSLATPSRRSWAPLAGRSMPSSRAAAAAPARAGIAGSLWGAARRPRRADFENRAGDTPQPIAMPIPRRARNALRQRVRASKPRGGAQNPILHYQHQPQLIMNKQLQQQQLRRNMPLGTAARVPPADRPPTARRSTGCCRGLCNEVARGGFSSGAGDTDRGVAFLIGGCRIRELRDRRFPN
jgi:hypothetical protein